MPEANFCQGCGRPFVAAQSIPAEPSQPAARAQATGAVPRTCFRCSTPLADGATVCAACGLDVEELFGAAASRGSSQADLRELAFFNRPPPPDPQTAAFRTYGGWLVVIVLALLGTFAAYAWLDASNVMSRLAGGGADVFSAEAVDPQPAAAGVQTRPTSAVAVTRPDTLSAGKLATPLDRKSVV